MKNIIISLIVFVSIYLMIYGYTTQINAINKNNTYEPKIDNENYRLNYVNKYIETIKTNNFESGFNMLTDSSKKNFNNDLGQYSTQIANIIKNMNKTDNGIRINIINDFYTKEFNEVEYEIISKEFEYIQNNEVYFSEEHKLFEEFKLIEYSPNLFKIHISKY